MTKPRACLSHMGRDTIRNSPVNNWFFFKGRGCCWSEREPVEISTYFRRCRVYFHPNIFWYGFLTPFHRASNVSYIVLNCHTTPPSPIPRPSGISSSTCSHPLQWFRLKEEYKRIKRIQKRDKKENRRITVNVLSAPTNRLNDFL